MLTFFYKTIKVRIFYAILLPLLLIQGINFFLYMRQINTEIRSQYEEISRAISAPFIASIENKLSTLEDAKRKKEFLEIYGDLKGNLEFELWLDAYDQIKAVSLVDATGLLLSQNQGADQMRIVQNWLQGERITSERLEDSIVVSLPLRNNDTAFAFLLFRFSETEIIDKEQAAMLWVGVTLFASILLCGILSWQLSGAVTKPINQLANDSKALAEGNLDHEISSLHLQNEIGTLSNNFRLMRDAIREKISQLARHQNNLELLVDERTEELQKAQEELLQQEHLSALGKLTATVSHELLNPLGTVKNAIFSLRKYSGSEESAKVEQALELAERNISRSVAIIEELNFYARDKQLMCSQTRLLPWLQALIGELNIPAQIKTEIDIPNEMTVAIDQDKMRQVMINLINNAVHALQERNIAAQALSISANSNSREWRLQVSDNGAGMSDETKEKIFEPLYSTKNFGIGIGMGVVKNITEKHGGRVDVDSTENGGTTISLIIPTAT